MYVFSSFFHLHLKLIRLVHLDNRGYAPDPPSRDTDGGRSPGPLYGRVRHHSPSPMGRSGSGSMDDSRPDVRCCMLFLPAFYVRRQMLILSSSSERRR